jgi:hypothetical protein
MIFHDAPEERPQVLPLDVQATTLLHRHLSNYSTRLGPSLGSQLLGEMVGWSAIWWSGEAGRMSNCILRGACFGWLWRLFEAA